MKYIFINKSDYNKSLRDMAEIEPTVLGDYYLLRFSGEIPQEFDSFRPYEKQELVGARQRISESGVVQDRKFENNSPFASKIVHGYKIFTRNHGISEECSPGENTIDFVVPYSYAKITGIDILWGVEGDRVSLYVVDTSEGSYSGVPNYILNQFGFNTCVTPVLHRQDSKYDADLYGGMIIRIVYEAKTEKEIGFNIKLHELK